MRYFLIALQFLTPIKIGKACIVPDQDLAKSMAWFSIVGLLIGLALAGAYYALDLFLPNMVASGIVVLFMIIASAGLHIDGLADTFDGLAGGKDKTEILRIMHDSNIGAIGAAAVFVSILVKFSCIYSIPKNTVYGALISSSVLSRWSFVFSAARWPSVGENQGLGKKFIDFVGTKELLLSTLVAFGSVLFVFRLKAIFILLSAAALIAVFNTFIKNKIGGLTGDTLGAIGEITEAAVLLFAVL